MRRGLPRGEEVGQNTPSEVTMRPEEPTQSIEATLDDLMKDAEDEDLTLDPAFDSRSATASPQILPQRLSRPSISLPHRGFERRTRRSIPQYDGADDRPEPPSEEIPAPTRISQAAPVQPQPANNPTAPNSLTGRAAPRGEAREQRQRAAFTRLFGTREDVQSDEYQSPLSSMFGRAWDRYRAAETARQSVPEGQAHEPIPIPNNTNNGGPQLYYFNDGSVAPMTPDSPVLILPPPDPVRTSRNQGITEIHGFYRTNARGGSPFSAARRRAPPRSEAGPRTIDARDLPSGPYLSEDRGQPLRENDSTAALNQHSVFYGMRRQPPRARTPSPVRGLDIDDGRPEPLPRDSMNRNMECKVCYTQLASEVMLPCGHLCMCKWCADQTVPLHASARAEMENGNGDGSGRVGRGVQCPSCRRTVRRRVRVFYG